LQQPSKKLIFLSKIILFMKMNAGTWIGLIGGGIGLIVGLGAIIATIGSSGSYISIGMLLIFGAVFFVIYKLLIAPSLLSARLQKTGIDGKALIKEVRDTGVTINNNPQVKLIVEIKNYLGQTYTATLRTLVSRINPFAYQPGMIIPVKIDPKNDNNVVIDTTGRQVSVNETDNFTASTPPAYDATATAALQKELEAMQRSNDVVLLTGTSAKAIIKKYTWLGVNVNGNNPYVELVMEVLPSAIPAFEATVKGVVAEQSVHKYQPGQEVFVKYDPLDLTKVAVDHS
jgi:hypothetical protein